MTHARTRKLISIAVTVALVMSLFIATPAMAKSSGKGKLIKSVTVHYYDTNKKKWVKDYQYAYKYNKQGDPTKITYTSYDSDTGRGTKSVTKNKFKYNKKKTQKKTLQVMDSDGNKLTKYTYKKNLRTKGSYVGSYSKQTYAYKNKGGYVTQAKITYKPSSGKASTYTTNYKVTLKKKLPKTIVAKNEDGSAYTTSSFNGKGLVSKVKYASSSAGYKIKYTNKKGLVRKAVRTRAYSDGSAGTKYRYTFKYTKKKTTKQRYARMINSCLDSGWFQCSWY